MKQAIVIVTLLLSIAAKSQMITDYNPFKTYLVAHYPACYTSDGSGGYTFISGCADVVNEDSLQFHGLGFGATELPMDLTDLVYFPSLVYLNISNNRIDHMGNFPATLKYINVDSTSQFPGYTYNLPALPPTLEYFSCKKNTLSLPALPPTLKYLNCAKNEISSLPALPSTLDTLICNSQRSTTLTGSPTTLSNLPALPNGLKYLQCSDNHLSSFPTLPSSLKWLDCSAQNYIDINCGIPGRILTSLPSLPSGLQYLNCSYNKLQALPNLPASLQYLDCSNMAYDNTGSSSCSQSDKNIGISALPVLREGLQTLLCNNNNILCLPPLPSTLTSLTFDNNLITCLPNATFANSTYPICGITYNSQQCTAAAFIEGDVFYDYNSNGIKDANERSARNIPVQLSSGLIGYTDVNGHYNLWSTTGNRTVTLVPPVYYNSLPASVNYTINTTDTSLYQQFALQANTTIDSVKLSLVPVGIARPGGYIYYHVTAMNVGTTTNNGSLSLTYDASLLSLENSSPVQQNGNILSVNTASMTPGTSTSFYASFNISTSAVVTDTIIAYAEMTLGSAYNRNSVRTAIRNSYDPNDKMATPQLSTQQVADGKYINYIIRFQNTGTDTAFNIILLDTLSANLNENSFEMITSSHTVKTTRNGNKIAFIFNDILLPDSNINEVLSHGFVEFRVKPKNTVVANTIIPNKASIYFDYNLPVLTNIANTTIQLNALPVKIVSFQGNLLPDDHLKLVWKTENEINVQRYEILKSTDRQNFYSIGNVNATGASVYHFVSTMDNSVLYFRLRVVDADGNMSLSPVIVLKRQSQPEIILSPNPASDVLHLQMNTVFILPATASIVNNNGQIIKKIQLNSLTEKINIMDLATGIYWLNVGGNKQSFIVKRK